MNEGDVFVIDCKKYIFVWVGRSANNMEKMHAAKVEIWNFLRKEYKFIQWFYIDFQLAQSLKGDHGESYSTLVIVEDGQELGLPDDERKAFEGMLPIQHKKVVK